MRSAALVLAALALAPAARAERHPVFSLVDNRPLAHLQRRGGLYIEAGSSGFARYVHFQRPLATWRLRSVEDKRKVAVALASARLEVPLTAAQAQAKVVYLGLKAPAASSVKIAAHGKSSAAVGLKQGWQVVSVPLPDGALAAGEDTLLFTFAKLGKLGNEPRGAAAVEFIQVGGTAPAKADPPTLSAGGIAIPKDSGVAFYAYVPQGGALIATGDGAGCKVTARAEGLGESEVKLDGTPLDLGALAGRFVRLDLAATGSCAASTLRRADLLADGPAPKRAAAVPPKNVIVWLTDDTRADKYRFYNPRSRVETPVFDELQKRSTVFRVAYTQGNESRVSHASIWTSTYPGVHQMIPEKAKLPFEKLTTLARAIRPSGRTTLGIMGNGFIDAFWGFGDGWDYLRNNIHDGGGLSADALLSDALKALDEKRGLGSPPKDGGAGGPQKDKPFFLYIGTIDSHVSWRAHEPWIKKYDPNPYGGPFVKACLDPQLEKIVLGKMSITERDKTRIQALYDSDVSYNDHVLGKLVDEMKKRGLDGNTMLILVSDHGEELWDHGRIGHGQSLREELIHVPFLMYYPPYFPAGHVVEEGVDALDILPTITDALGVATPETVQGESLIPLAEGIGAGYPRPSIGSQYELAHTMRLGRYKLWVGGSGEVHLFDAAEDPHEDHELSQSRPVERRALTDALGLWMANRNQWKKRKWGVASNLSPAFAADLDK